MGCCLSVIKRPRPQLEPKTFGAVTQSAPPPGVPDPSSGYPGQEQGNEEMPAPADQPQYTPPSLDPAMHADENEETATTNSSSAAHTDDEDAKQEETPGSDPDHSEDLPSPLEPATDVDKNEGLGLKGEPDQGTVQPQDAPSSSDFATHAEKEEIIITSIRAIDVALGLRRVPVGFYITVHYGGLEWKTENKPTSVNSDVVEWSRPIPIPSDPSATVSVEVNASFEYQPMLGAGEQLRKLTITVGQLLDCSARDVAFTFSPEDGDVISPCSSILISVERRKCKSKDFLVSTVLGSDWSTTESPDELEDATNRGHGAFSCYQKHGKKQDLERALREFERALSISPSDHPCLAAAQSNLAMAKFIFCQVEGTNTSLEIPLNLYRDALGARPVGHVDRPSTLIQLAAVHFVRFERLRDEVERARAEALLHEAVELGSAESHENRAAAFMLQLHAGRSMGVVRPDSQLLVDPDSTSRSTGEDLRTLSVQLLTQFKRFGDLADLEEAIKVLKELVRSTSVCDDKHGAGLGNLGAALLYRFEQLGELSDLEDAISTLRDAVNLAPHGHRYKPGNLNNLGTAFTIRFERLGELSDLESAISTLRDTVELTPHDHIHKPALLNSLGGSLKTRFKRLGELTDLESAISTLEDVVQLTPHGHSDRPCYLSNLGSFLSTRFERLGELSDLENAILALRDAVDLTPPGHPDKPDRLGNLGSSLRTRFERLGELNDLENAMSILRDAIDLTPHGHPHKPCHLSNLGGSFTARFERLGKLSDLENAVSTLGDAVDLTPSGHPDKPNYLNSLGASLSTRFECLGELSDLENSILTLRDAVDFTPRGHHHKPTYLNNLGSSFKARFERLGELSDLENAILTFRTAADLTPDSRPHKPSILSNLGSCLRARFKLLDEPFDLENAISILKDTVDLTPVGHPHKAFILNSLGASFSTHYQRFGELSNLENAISTLMDAVDLIPQGHPDKPGGLSNLGASFIIRFERLGELSDLENAISTLRDAINLTPPGHPDKPNRLGNIGSSFRARFERLGELNDLESAISTLSDAVDLTPDGHPRKSNYLNTLGYSLRTRFERLDELSDLESAISTLRDAVGLTPWGHPDKPDRLNNLGASFTARFERLGELSDIENAISMLRDAVELTPHDHPDKPSCLVNLGNSFRSRFERLGELSDLENAISTLSEAVDITPHGHTDRPGYLSSLGASFLVRFGHLGDLSDVEKAISIFREGVESTPHGHPHKPRYLSNLGISFRARFKHLGDLSDLDNAISTLRNAVDLTPHGHPEKPSRLDNLGMSLSTRFERLEELNDLEHAISLYCHAASSPFGRIRVRFRASQKWISCAHRIHHHSLLHAYSVAIGLLPQLAWIGLSLSHRYSELTRGADVVRDAAAAALDLGFPETAVELLERGRSIVWGELFALRGSYEELSSVHPDYARRLRELSAALEHASATRETSLALSEQIESPPGTLQEEADRHRMLAIERDKLLREIRRLPGFERFLLHKEFPYLRASAHTGPVVMLNAAQSRCDALIIIANVDHVIHVPLLNFTFKQSIGLQNTLKGFVRRNRVIRSDEREGAIATLDGVSWESFFSPLWKCVVKPVLDASAFSIPGDLSRIFWCPTGPFVFLPIHAAGLYDAEYSQPGHKAYDFVISSYIPTLAIFALSPDPTAIPSGDLRLLAVRQPSSDGQSRLPGAVTELQHIKAIIGDSVHTTLLEPSTGTVEEVLDLMKKADWVHFACHGIQDPTDPADSGLCLANGRCLTLRDMIALSRPHGGLAFLSACQTATGDKKLTDEAIHIAAGMLFAGYGGVVGTMWSISDRLAPGVAKDVYEELFRNGTWPDYREAARALHEAVRRLRESGDALFDEWLPFIHVGL